MVFLMSLILVVKKGSMDEKSFWTNRYKTGTTGWDIGYPSTPIKEYVNQLPDKSISILIPGAGNAYEAEYLFQKGFRNINVLDISEIPLASFKHRNPEFPSSQLFHEDFFKHNGKYDLILEQTFFCSFIPTDQNRIQYFKTIHHLLCPEGILAGVWFNFPLTEDMETRPFGGNKELYMRYLKPYFKVHTFESCYNSIPERQGKELFAILERK